MTKFSRWLGKNGIGTERLAELTNYSVAAVKAWRAGTRNPSEGARLVIALRLSRYGLTERRLKALLRNP